MKKFMFLCLMALTLALVYPAGSAEAASDTIHQGVFIGDVDVSGMTTAQATEAVNQYIEQLRAKNVTLRGKNEGQSVTVTMGDFGLGWANPGVVDEAFSLCRAGNIIQRYKAIKDLEHSTQRYNIEYSFNDDAIYQILEVNCAPFNVSKVNYNLTKTSEGFNISEGQTGYILDERTSLVNIKDFVQNSWDHNDCAIDVVIDEDLPQGSYEELSQVKDVLGTFTTSYSSSGAARSANVANGCSLINGTTIYPGEEFSVLDTITPFTEANGYFPAGSYLNGIVVESVGGGICQVSTTLYNAVLKAELEVTERHNHSMIINYVEPSMDAAIAENGGKNFKFVNSTEHPIYIEGYTSSDKHITFTIYGVETRPSSHKVEFQSEVLETTPAGADQVVADGGSPVGTVNVQSAHIGYKAQLWKITYENGQVSDRQVVNSSNYKMVPRIITVGTATADPTAAAQIGTAIATGDINQIKAVAGAIAAVQQVAAQGGDVEAAQAAAAAQAASAEAQLAAQQAAQAAEAAPAEAPAATQEVAPAPAPEQAPAPAPAEGDTPAPIDPEPEEVPPPAE
ncbi:VanW family protein [Butyrivibrio sp. VCD2006]|uniref:VanW family protein n=1 Tax=Butyrivibrio sp. VCD2006 TaxID=1280664 RepID=UPI0018CB1AF4|nr:VanW family protein [Butyrivibrio sp. VCD2006]